MSCFFTLKPSKIFSRSSYYRIRWKVVSNNLNQSKSILINKMNAENIYEPVKILNICYVEYLNLFRHFMAATIYLFLITPINLLSLADRRVHLSCTNGFLQTVEKRHFCASQNLHVVYFIFCKYCWNSLRLTAVRTTSRMKMWRKLDMLEISDRYLFIIVMEIKKEVC